MVYCHYRFPVIKYHQNIKGDEHLWLITTARIVLSEQNTTTIPNRFWGGYGDGISDGVPDGRRIKNHLRVAKELN